MSKTSESMTEIDNETVARQLEELAALVRASSVRQAEFNSEADMFAIPRGRYVSHEPSGFQTHTMTLRIKLEEPADPASRAVPQHQKEGDR